MSVIERIEALENKFKDRCPFKCVVKDEVQELGNQTETLNVIFGESYVDMLRQLQEAIILILDYLFLGDPNYVKSKKFAALSTGKDLGHDPKSG